MLSKRLKEARKNKKYTQETLAKKINTTKGTISNYENGYSTPSNEILIMLADILEVSVDYLLGRGSARSVYQRNIVPLKEAKEILENKKSNHIISEKETDLLNKINDLLNSHDEGFDLEIINNAEDFLGKEKNKENDIAKRLEQVKQDLENTDGLAFDGEPMSDEAKESLLESMELLFRQTQRINKKFTPKKFREDE